MKKKEKKQKQREEKIFIKGECSFAFKVPDRFQKIPEKKLIQFYKEQLAIIFKQGNIDADDIEIFFV